MNGGRDNRLLLTLLASVNILNTMDRQIVAALLEPIRGEFHLTDSQLGVLSGIAYSLPGILAAVPIAMLADRFSRKTVLTAAFTLWSAFTALCGAATGHFSLLLARIGVGATGSAGPPCCLSMIADSFPEDRRAGPVGIFFGSSEIGSMLTFSVGAWTAAHFGWRYSFFVASAPALILIPILMFFLIEPARYVRTTTSKNTPIREAISAITTNRQLTLVIVGTTMTALPGSAMYGWATSLLIRDLGLELSRSGLVVAIATGLFIPMGMFIGGRLSDRLAARRPGAPMLLASVSCVGGGALGIIVALSSATGITITALCCHAFIVVMYTAPTLAVVMQLAPAGSRTTILAIVQVLATFSSGCGPLLVGFISDRVGGSHSLSSALALVCSLSFLPGILFAFLGRRMTEKASPRLAS